MFRQLFENIDLGDHVPSSLLYFYKLADELLILTGTVHDCTSLRLMGNRQGRCVS